MIEERVPYTRPGVLTIINLQLAERARRVGMRARKGPRARGAESRAERPPGATIATAAAPVARHPAHAHNPSHTQGSSR